MRSRRGLARRLNTLATRLEPPGTAVEARGLEQAVERLERAVADSAAQVSEAVSRVDRLEGALAEVGDGVLVCDEHGIVVYRNEVATALTDTRHGETLPGKTLSQLLDGALDGQRGTKTVELLGPPRRTLTITAIPLDDGRRAVGAVAVMTDVSERHRLDTVRRDLVENMGRVLRTPVATIAGLAATLVDEGDKSTARRLAERIRAEAGRTGQTIDDLLELTTVEREEAPRREAIAVSEIVTSAITAAGAEWRVTIAEHAPRVRVLGDRSQLVTALRNLIANAVTYSKAGTPVEVEVSRAGTSVAVAVRDRGVGINGREIDRVFERFFRGEHAERLDPDGTGLGLSIVRHVAGSHGGEVTVESEAGAGSTFTLRLPAAPGAITLPAAEAG